MSFVAKEAYNDMERRYIQCRDVLYRIIANYRRSDEDSRGVSSMEYLIEEAEYLVLHEKFSETDDLAIANAQAAALRRALNEALMLLDTYHVPVPDVTKQALIVHGSAKIAGQTFLERMASLEARAHDLERALDARHLTWIADRDTIARLKAEVAQLRGREFPLRIDSLALFLSDLPQEDLERVERWIFTHFAQPVDPPYDDGLTEDERHRIG